MSEKIDFIITWVDGSDPEWQALKDKYATHTAGDTRINRFRDWGNLQFWFRAVEKFAPWVNKIHFVSWGHYPTWLKLDHPKLSFVRHEDYIPEEYLPTFSSRVIELNLHRISDLADNFVLFNDDMFVIKPVQPDLFFKAGLPRDAAILKPVISTFRNSICCNVINNMEIINTTFNKKQVVSKNWRKWFHPVYRRNLLSTITLLPYPHFVGFINPHLPISYRKEIFSEVWAKEQDILHETCLNRFRNRNDVNQWLFRYWQLVQGRFIPRSAAIGRYFSLTNDNRDVCQAIINQKHQLVCLNDDNRDPIKDFKKEKELIRQAFYEILPEKSTFEL